MFRRIWQLLAWANDITAPLRQRSSSPYLVAVGARTMARALWGILLPMALGIVPYGQYGLLTIVLSTAVQLSVLGAPQIFARNGTDDLPVAGIVAHATVLGVVLALAGALLDRHVDWAQLATIGLALELSLLYAIASARAKGRLHFGLILRAEIAGVVVLGAAALLVSYWARRGDQAALPLVAIGAEGLSAGASAVLLLSGQGKLSRTELRFSRTREFLPAIYSVGFLVAVDVILWRRVEVYFLEASRDGLVGVAVLTFALQMASLFLLAPNALLETWQPRFAMMIKEDVQLFRGFYNDTGKQFRRILGLILVVAVVSVPVGVHYVFPKYAPWVWLVTAMIAVRIATAVGGFYSSVTYAIGFERRLYRPVVLSAALCILLNTFLTIRHGLDGAVVSYSATQIVLCALTFMAIHSAMLKSPRFLTAGGSMPEMAAASTTG